MLLCSVDSLKNLRRNSLAQLVDAAQHRLLQKLRTSVAAPCVSSDPVLRAGGLTGMGLEAFEKLVYVGNGRALCGLCEPSS
eukprot:2226257-Amphidinium_carterae.2